MPPRAPESQSRPVASQRASQSGTPSPPAAPRRRAAWRGAPHPCQPGTSAAPSLDDLIRPPQQRWRDRQAEGLGGLEVDDQLELRRLLDGQVGGLGALEDLVDVGRGPPKHISKVRSIGHEAPGIDKLSK